MLNKENVLSRTNKGIDIFRHFLPGAWRVGRNFLNPLYKDTKPSCNVYLDRKNQVYRMKDFGNNDYSGDAFTLVGKLHGLDCGAGGDFMQILKIINDSLHLSLEEGDIPAMATNPHPPMHEMEDCRPDCPAASEYRMIPRAFDDTDMDFWSESGITEDILHLYHVVALREYSSVGKTGRPFTLTGDTRHPIYGYTGKSHIKLYRPGATDFRFLYGGDFGEQYCFGLEQLPMHGDTLFITGGEKDVMTLASHAFYAICFGSETGHIPEGIIRSLSHRFKHIILLFDTDATGKECSLRETERLARYHVKRLLLPLAGSKEEKDISDYFRLGNTAEDFMALLVSLLDELYEETFSMLKPCEVDLINPPVIPQTIISINDVPFGTEGNLLCVTGGEGSGKSNYVGALISGSLTELQGHSFLGSTIQENYQKRAVLLYDTEQSMNQLHKNTSVILRRAGCQSPPDCFKVYCLNSVARKDRLKAITQSMDKYYYQYGGLHLVVIDGIADLIQSVNDEMDSVELIDELYRLAGIYNTCIICVVHLVPNGMKIRGHLGSEISRKAAGILSIDRDEKKNISCVKAIKVRDGSPLDVPPIEFGWDKEQGMHVFLREKSNEDKEYRKETELQKLVLDLFKSYRVNSFTYKGLKEAIQQAMDVSDGTAKNYIRFMREKNIIVNNPVTSNELILGVP